MVGSLWFIHMTNQTVLSGGVVQSESPLDWHSPRVSSDSLNNRPKQQHEDQIVEYEKHRCAHIAPWMDIEDEELHDTEVDEDNDGNDDYQEGIWAFLSQVLHSLFDINN